MNTRALVLAAALCAFGLVAPLQAQTSVGKPAPVETSTLAEAVQLRTNLVNAILAGETKAPEAVAQLRKPAARSGLPVESDADFAFAAIDLGHRLLALRHPAEAEPFFQAAEQSLNQVIARTADAAAGEKRQYLQARAAIRANYLDKLPEARADLEAALRLSPGDKRLRQMQRLIPADPAAAIQNHKEQPTKG